MLLSIAVPIVKSCLCVLLSGECVFVVIGVSVALLSLTDRLTLLPSRTCARRIKQGVFPLLLVGRSVG